MFIFEGNPELKHGLVNMQRLDYFYRYITIWKKTTAYEFNISPMSALQATMQNIFNLQVLDDAEYYKISFELEPRGASKKEIN